MENYICINGKKAELTEEQMKALGIELPKASPFSRNKINYDKYYYIGSEGSVYSECDNHGNFNDSQFDAANYCTDKAIMEQRALHETLNRLLWRYSMEHDGDKINLNNNSVFRFAIKKTSSGAWNTFPTNGKLFGVPMFTTLKVAENAIEEIIKPFMEKHPEFKF